MNRSLIIFIVLLVVVALYLIIVYNGLVSKRNMARNAFSSIDVNLKKRADLIPALVNTVKGYAAHEQETLARVIELRNQIQNAETDGERFRLEGQVGPEIEEQISAARRAYNAAVFEINNSVESFPTNLIAAKFDFKRHDFFEANASDRAISSVSF
ncbi:MAG: LemA family protein [Verrucomicrobiales bacterium]